MRALIGVAAASTLVLAGCGAADDPFAGTDDEADNAIVVGSANHAENVLLGEIYAQALEGGGFDVIRKPNIGSREVLYQQVESCEINVVPEYNGALLSYLDPEHTSNTTETVDAALKEALPSQLKVLDSSDAFDSNAIAVKSEVASELELETLEDLVEPASEMIAGGPPEWEPRADGLKGLEEQYGLKFKEFKVLGDVSGPISVSALKQDDVDVVLMQSSSPQLTENDFVALDDPLNVLGINNIIPLVCEEALDEEANEILQEISNSMTTDELIEMNKEYTIDKDDAADVAERWLTASSIID